MGGTCLYPTPCGGVSTPGSGFSGRPVSHEGGLPGQHMAEAGHPCQPPPGRQSRKYQLFIYATLMMGQYAPGGCIETRLNCDMGHFVMKLSTAPATWSGGHLFWSPTTIPGECFQFVSSAYTIYSKKLIN